MMGVTLAGGSHVFYDNGNHHVNRFFWRKAGTWHGEDLTAATGGPQVGAGSGLSSLINAGGCPHVQYVDVNQHVNDLWMGNTSRSEESRGGKGGRTRWSTEHSNQPGSPLGSMASTRDIKEHA